MSKKLINLRVEEVDFERWRGHAGEAQLSVSEWIRRQLNGVGNGVKVQEAEPPQKVAKKREWVEPSADVPFD